MGGEAERELMIFTNGFILSRVEMDTLVNLLLGDEVVSSASASDDNDHSLNEGEELTSSRLSQRFHVIDSDGSGCKYLYSYMYMRFLFYSVLTYKM